MQVSMTFTGFLYWQRRWTCMRSRSQISRVHWPHNCCGSHSLTCDGVLHAVAATRRPSRGTKIANRKVKACKGHTKIARIDRRQAVLQSRSSEGELIYRATRAVSRVTRTPCTWPTVFWVFSWHMHVPSCNLVSHSSSSVNLDPWERRSAVAAPHSPRPWSS